MTTTIMTDGLTKVYSGRPVVDDLDLEIGAGEVFGLLGPNGAGKTTTILMLLGLVEPTAGSLEVLGLDPRRHPLEVKHRVGYLPDAVGFYETLTGRENLRFTARLNAVEDAESRMSELLSLVGLAEAGDQEAGTYSRGMKQRLGVADALIKDPSVLILDEPTTAIDPEGVAEMLGLIRRLAEDKGVTVLLSSHLLHQVQAVCDRVAIFVDGVVVAQGRPHELAADGEGPEQVELRLEGDHGAITSALEGCDEVQAFRPGRLPGLWSVEVERGAMSRTIARLVHSGVEVSGARRTDDDLDAVYRRYFERAPA